MRPTLIPMGTHGGAPLRLGPGTNLVGRSPENAVGVSHKTASRLHAALHVDLAGVWVEDLGSQNGTWVNDVRVEERTALLPGDRLRFGDAEFLLAQTDSLLSELLVSDGSRWVRQLSAIRDAAPSPEGVIPLPAAFLESLTGLIRATTPDEIVAAAAEVARGAVGGCTAALFLCPRTGGELFLAAAEPENATIEIPLEPSQLQVILSDRTTVAWHGSVPQVGGPTVFIAPLWDGASLIGLAFAVSEVRDCDSAHLLARFAAAARFLMAKMVGGPHPYREAAEDHARSHRDRMVRAFATIVRDLQRQDPRENPLHLGPYDVAAMRRSGEKVAGDFYDIRALDDRTMFLVVGDVSGKGAGAATLASTILASLRVLYSPDTDLAQMVERLNQEVVEFTEAEKFATLFLARVDLEHHRCTYVNAGHFPPWRIVPGLETVSLGATGLPIGMFPGVSYELGSIDLPPASLLCVYTDGMIEATRGEDFYGEERLQDCVRRWHGIAESEEILNHVSEDLTSFLGPLARVDDDVTLLIARRADPTDAVG